MPQEVENELLKLDDRYAHAAARFPPSVGVKAGVARGLNRHPDRIGLSGHDPSTRLARREWSLVATNTMDRMSCWADQDGRMRPSRSVPTLDAADLHDVCYAEGPQLPNLSCARILVRKPAADELVILSARRI